MKTRTLFRTMLLISILTFGFALLATGGSAAINESATDDANHCQRFSSSNGLHVQRL
jgi:hypothetical protein